MQNTIWKFTFNEKDVFEFTMPKGAKILTLQRQHNLNCIWAWVNPAAETEKRTFAIFGTGHPIPITVKQENYIGTYQVYSGQLVFHLFEI